MPQRIKYIITLSVMWSIASLFLLASIHHYGYPETHIYLFQLLLLLSPVWLYWLCIWLWGRVPLPKSMSFSLRLGERIKMIPNILAGLLLANIAQVSGFTNTIVDNLSQGNNDNAVITGGVVSVVAFILGLKLSEVILRKCSGALARRAVLAFYITCLFVVVGVNSEQHKKEVLPPIDIKTTPGEVADIIWESMSDEDRRAWRRDYDNSFESAAKKLKEEGFFDK